MNSKRLWMATITVCILLLSVSGQAGWWPFSDDKDKDVSDITTLYWEDLIPDDFVQPENPFATMTQEEVDKLLDGSDESNARLNQLQEEFNYAPVVDELDGKRVKIPAYVTPLEFDGQTKMSEFLLVPYVGACLHTPPPPANQVVHANSDEVVEFKNIYDPIWAIGTIRAETVQSDLAESGYRLEIESVEPYTGAE